MSRNETMLAASVLLASLLACAPAGDPEPQTEEQKALYVLGMQVSDLAKNFQLTEEELPYVRRGFSDRTLGAEPLAAIEDYAEAVNELLDGRMVEVAKGEKLRSESWMKGFAQMPNAVSGDGFHLITLEEGTGEQPRKTDTVHVRYTAKLRTGETVDSSTTGGAADGSNTITLGKVIPCLNRAVPRTREGGRYRVICASWVAHGNRGLPPMIPGGAALDYDLEVIRIERLFRDPEEKS